MYAHVDITITREPYVAKMSKYGLGPFDSDQTNDGFGVISYRYHLSTVYELRDHATTNRARYILYVESCCAP